MPPPRSVLAARLDRVRDAVAAHAWDALLVTRPTNLHYLLGVDTTAGHLIVRADGAEVLIDGRYRDALAETLDGWDAVELVPLPVGRSYEETTAERLHHHAARLVAVEAAHMTLARLGAVTRALATPSQVAWVETHDEIERMRAVKDPWEQTVLRDAGRRLASVAACILPKVSVGHTERDIAWTVAGALHDAGFERPAFETIVASGPHAARPHHRPTDRRLAAGDLVILDFGGVLEGYAVDMTRTVGLGADASSHLWLDAVARAQAAAFAACQPGASPADVDRAARESLRGDGLDALFTHSTGHGLGLDVHERPSLGPTGNATGPLTAGMVFTLEPGIYVPGEGGVRIEDDVLLTDTGAEWLTRPDVASEMG